MATRLFLIVSIVSLFSLGMGIAFAETESFTVAARDYEQKNIHLNEGDEIEYTVTVSGGKNDDIEFTIYYPDGSNDGGGSISGNFDGKFVAQTSGTYIFKFDSPSVLSNKSVKFSYDITKNTYFVYVDPIPEWADYASNVMYDATKYWEKIKPNLKFHVAKTPQEADFTVQWVRDFGQEHIGYAYNSEFVEVGLGDSNCQTQWKPYSSNHVAQIMKHEIGHILGYKHSDNPDSIMYPSIPSEYGSPCVSTEIPDTATIDVSIFGDTYDFSPSGYQNKDDSIRFEDGNGKIIYKYDAKSNLGQLFNSFGMSLTDDCFVFQDGRNFCNNEEYSLRFFVNEQERSSLSHYTFNDGDRIKISYDSVPKPQVSTLEPESTQLMAPTCGKGTELVNGICQVIKTEEKSKGGGCLIATATYGSELAPQVQQLRELRDNSLLQTESGKSFMNTFNDFYYSFSPIIADWERENPAFKEAVKITLTPMISSLSILNHVDMDSEAKVLGYGISLIMLNGMMYVGLPIIGIISLRKIIN